MWKDKYVAFGIDPELDPTYAETRWIRSASFVWFELENSIDGARILDVKTYRPGLTRDRMVQDISKWWTKSTVVAHNLDYNFKFLANEVRRHGFELAFPLPALDVHLVDFGLRPGKRKRHVENVCKRWGVQFEIASNQDTVMAVGLVAAKMIPQMPNNQLELAQRMSLWRKGYLKMRAAQRQVA